jgi:uncharacterized protein (DUF58 family)
MRPSARLVRLAAAWLLLSLAAAFVPSLLAAWSVAGAVLAAVALADLALALRRAPLAVERAASSSISLGAWTPVTLSISNPTSRAEAVEVFDGVPPEAEFEGLPRALAVPAGSGARFDYRLRALRRGDALFSPVEVRRASPFALWQRRERTPIEQRLRVYPDFAAVAGLTLHALENRIQLLGIRRKRRRGEGLEFHQMRDYQVGDTLRQIDWKATSRRRKLIAREYQEERDQELLFLVDCGRRMRATDGELTHFDHGLNAILLVAYIALRQGDAVGFATFGGVERKIRPIKGRQSMTALLNALYDLDTTLEPSDFVEAASRLKALHSRRCLVILVTNQRDEDEEELRPALELLRRRHLVVLASLRETRVDALARAPIDGFEAALRSCAALDYVQRRRAALERLRGRGVIALDLAPRELPVALANQYLDIKRAGRL